MTPARPLFALAILAALAAAGCTGSSPTAPKAVTTDEARTALDAAIAHMPSSYGFNVSIEAKGKQLLSMQATFDNATKTTSMGIRGDASLLGGVAQSAPGISDVFQTGFSIFSGPQGGAYLARDVAIVFPATNATPNRFLPPPGASNFHAFLRPDEVVENLTRFAPNITSVSSIAYQGEPAVRINATMERNGTLLHASIVVLSATQRLAHVETDIPSTGSASPFAGGTTVADFAYGSVAAVPESFTRAVSLAHATTATRSGHGTTTTWTFQNAPVVLVGEVEAQVKDPKTASAAAGSANLSRVATLWSLPFSEGNRTVGNLTLEFRDADHDGKVGKGDTLTITDATGAPPDIVLFDTKTGTYVVPGPGVAVALLAAGLAALALGRRTR